MENARVFHLHPDPDRREWLLDRLADLAERAGVEPLVSWPLIEPDDWFFPDHWNVEDDRTILRLARRMLWYTGLDELAVVLHFLDDPPHDERPAFVVEPQRPDAVAWFAAIEGHHCHFGLLRARLTTPSAFLETMVHEVARAYRAIHHLEVIDGETEAQLTDITTVFLGTGVISANATDHNELDALDEQSPQRRRGSLPRGSLAFLLAARCFLRDPDEAEIHRVAELLEPAQREVFLQSIAYFDGQDESLAHRLRLPPKDTWAPIEPVELLVEWDGSVDVAVKGSLEAAPSAREVFDLTRARERDYGLQASGASVIACIVAATLDPGDWRAALLAVPIVAFVAGTLRRYELCGSKACGGRVQLGQRCARCDSLAVSEDHPWS